MVLAPVDWRSEWRIDRRNARRAERRRRPSFLPYRFSETILPGAPPSLPPPVLLPLQRPLEMDPGISLFPLLPLSLFPYISLHRRAREGGGRSQPGLDATAAAIPRSCRRNFTCFEWRGPIEGPKERPMRSADADRVHLCKQPGRLLKTNIFRPISQLSQIDPPSSVAPILIH